MFGSFSDIEAEHFDVCVIGSGPAGLAFCLRFAKCAPEKKILLLDVGSGSQKNELDDTISNLNPRNHHDPYDCTNKGLGGTSATWGGRCVSYDEIDFIPRSIIGEECTWDLSVFQDVKKYYAEASEFLECGKPCFDLHQNSEYPYRAISENFLEGDFLDSVLERWSMPSRLGSRYKQDVEVCQNLVFVPGCLADSFGEDKALLVKQTVDGKKVRVRAARFVIAAGAQESTRLLLKSPALFSAQGGLPPQLGRYYQGHVSGKIASVRFTGDPKKTDFGFCTDADGVYSRRRLQIPTKILEREGLLNTAIWLDNPPYHDPSHRSGTMSFIYLSMLLPIIGKRLAPPAIADSVTKGNRNSVGAHIGNVLKGIPKSLWEPFTIFVRRYLAKRKLPGVFLFNPKNEYALHFHAEQVPVVSNYMQLTDDGKGLAINYQYQRQDLDSIIRTHELLDSWLRKTGAGEIVYWYPHERLAEVIDSQSKDGIHQVGTTRMSMRQEDGVVDPDLKVWGTENVYVCSSSVFPTSGQANPTFLLTAFALRLAERLKTL